MSYKLTEAAKLWASQPIIEPNLVMKIPKINKVFGVLDTFQLARYGQGNLKYGDPGLVYGGLSIVENSNDLISISGTADTISQQLDADKPEANSTSSLLVRLLDENEDISNLISFDATGVDLLYEKVVLSFGGKDLIYPTDYVDVFIGRITSIVPGNGFVDFTISHPDDKKRGDVFPLAETTLAQDLNFQSATIQNLFFQQRPDVAGVISIQFTSGASGDVALITIAGNTIQVQIDSAATKIKTIKKSIENNADANQLVTVSVVSNPDSIATPVSAQALTSGTEVFLNDVSVFLEPNAPYFRTFCKIQDEIIEYTGIDFVAKKLTGLVRKSLNSFGFSSKIGESATSIYMLGDSTSENSNAIDLALMLLLSGGDEFYLTNLGADKMGADCLGNSVTNAVCFIGLDIEASHGTIVGDFISSSGSIETANNFSNRRIVEIINDDIGS